MEQLIELFKQMQELAGVGLDMVQGAAGAAAGKEGGAPRPGGGAPPHEGGGAPPKPEGGGGEPKPEGKQDGPPKPPPFGR
jgi:hypothetical protein